MDRGTCPWIDSHYGGLYSIVLQRVRHDSVTDRAHIWLPSLSVTISSSIHVAANGIISFFWMAEWYSIVCMHHIFTHSSVNGYLLGLATVSNGAMKIGVHVPFQIRVFSKYMSRRGISPYYSLFLEITLLPLQPCVLGKFSFIRTQPKCHIHLDFDLASQKHLLFHFFVLPQNLVHTSLCWHSACGFILGSFTSWSSVWDCKLFEDQDTSFQQPTWLSRVHHCSQARCPSYPAWLCTSGATS